MPFCTNCGQAYQSGVRFCTNCGTQLNSTQSNYSSAPVPAVVNGGPSAKTGALTTVDDLMAAANKYQLTNLEVYRLAFEEVIKLLRPDEHIVCAFTGSSATRRNNSMLWFVGVAVTNQRILIGGQIKGLVKVSYTAQSFNIENVNAISQTYSIIGGDLIIDTLGDDIRIGESSRDTVNAIIADVDAAVHQVKMANRQGSAVIQQTSAADELKKYKELLDMGVITQEEFDLKKKQLLGL